MVSRAYRCGILLLSLLVVYGCVENDLLPTEVLNDRIEVRGEMIGPDGPVSFNYAVTDGDDPYVAAGELPVGFGRPSGVSAVAYLTRRTPNTPPPPGGTDCQLLSPDQPLDTLPGRPAGGTFFLEIVSTQVRTEDCLLDRSETNVALDSLTGNLGTEPGQINFYLTADVNPQTDFTELYPVDYGQLTVVEIDTMTGDVLGVPGAYVEFQIRGGTVRQPSTGDVYELTSLDGRVFFEYAVR